MKNHLNKLIRWKVAFEDLIEANLIDRDNAEYHKVLDTIDKIYKKRYVIN